MTRSVLLVYPLIPVGMTRFTPGSKPEAIATGLRGCNGTGVSPDGSIVFAMPQEDPGNPPPASSKWVMEATMAFLVQARIWKTRL